MKNNIISDPNSEVSHIWSGQTAIYIKTGKKPIIGNEGEKVELVKDGRKDSEYSIIRPLGNDGVGNLVRNTHLKFD